MKMRLIYKKGSQLMLIALVVSSIFAVISAVGITATVRAVATDGYRRQPTREYAPR
jgi:hypothetical protein